MTPRQRLLGILRGTDSASTAVLCPGGMMSMAVREVMERCGAAWPQAHSDARRMVTLALAMQEATGFESVSVPFCMTVEAERYGALVDMGSVTVQPKVGKTLFEPSEDFSPEQPRFSGGRSGVLLEALHEARRARRDVALIGNVVGPFSLLAMLTRPLQVMRWTRREPERLRRYLAVLTGHLASFARLQVEAGADAVCIAEPTATGEILGGRLFREFILGCLNRLAGEVRAAGAAAIVHICGDTRRIEDELRELRADAVSFDSMVDIVALKRHGVPWRVMGNVSAFQLASGPVRLIEAYCRRLLEGGVRLVAPACGIIPVTPASHLRAMSEAVSRSGATR